MSSLPPSSYPPPPDPRQPYYSSYPAQSGYAGPPPSKTKAGWSLGLAIFPSCITWMISLGLAISVISDAKDGRDHGQKMAALIIVGVWVVVAIAGFAVLAATDADRDETGRVTDGGRASVLDLRVGDCLPDFDTGRQTTVHLVECDQPHTSEIYALFDLEGEFTTREEVSHLAQAGCFDRFEAYVGIKPRKSGLRVFDLLPPDKLTFDQDPGVTCILVSSQPVTGTMQGSKR